MKIFSLLLLIYLNTGFSQNLVFFGKQDTITFQENDLIKLSFVEHALVYGDNKPYLVALLVLTDEQKNLKKEEIDKEINKINNYLSNIERIKKYFVINEKFSIENGMLTPTLKLKRYKIIKKYQNQFEKLY